MTCEDICYIDYFIEDKQKQYARALTRGDKQALLESSDELSNAYSLTGNVILAQKWTKEYHRQLGGLLSTHA